jgi:hypothetical protein
LLRHGRGRRGVPELLATLVERAVLDGPHAYWRFIEHRAAEPLLAPGVGWMQGAAGIAAFLCHAARVARGGPDAVAVPRMDTWWAIPPTADTDRGALETHGLDSAAEPGSTT